MRAYWQGLTTRGHAVLAGGVLVALLAVALGQRELLRIAVLLVALPVVAALVLGRRDDRLTVVRELEPEQAPVGGTATVRIRVHNVGTRTSGPLVVEDRLDRTLGVVPRLLVERLAPGAWAGAEYEVAARVRGRHRIGPMALRIEDPFGLVRTTRTATTTHTLIVTPVVAPLRRGALLAAAGGTGDGLARRAAAGGQDDVGTREYRSGDELRRVHWRATARTGSLMVRQEEQPWEAQALVLLDGRARAHSPASPAAPADLTTSSFEWAVHAAASIVTHLAQTDRRVRLVAGDTEVTVTGGSTAPMLDALAVLRPAKHGELVPHAAHESHPPVVVAVLGSLEAADVAALTALRGANARGVAVVLDPGTWAGAPTAGTTAGAPDAQAALAPLVAAGWHAVLARRGDVLADVWDRATR